jgi:transcriptional regulator with XRE-family HTH domain
MKEKKIHNRIAELRMDRHWTQADLAEELGCDRVTVARLETGATRLNTDWLLQLSEVFKVPPEFILSQNDTMGDPVVVVGAIEAGAWLPSPEFSEKQRYIVSIPQNKAWLGIEKHASEVRDRSADQLYPPGSVVIWLPFATRPEKLTHGKRYVIERRRGNLSEVSLKEYGVDPSGREYLETRSTDPELAGRTPLRARPGERIRVLGRVVSSYRPEE